MSSPNVRLPEAYNRTNHKKNRVVWTRDRTSDRKLRSRSQLVQFGLRSIMLRLLVWYLKVWKHADCSSGVLVHVN